MGSVSDQCHFLAQFALLAGSFVIHPALAGNLCRSISRRCHSCNMALVICSLPSLVRHTTYCRCFFASIPHLNLPILRPTSSSRAKHRKLSNSMIASTLPQLGRDAPSISLLKSIETHIGITDRGVYRSKFTMSHRRRNPQLFHIASIAVQDDWRFCHWI